MRAELHGGPCDGQQIEVQEGTPMITMPKPPARQPWDIDGVEDLSFETWDYWRVPGSLNKYRFSP